MRITLLAFCKPLILLLLSYGCMVSPVGAQDYTIDWVHGFGSASQSMGRERIEEFSSFSLNDGYLYSTGTINDTVDFDPTSGVMNAFTINDATASYIYKATTNGDPVWVKTLDGGRSEVHDIATDSLGNIYIVGLFSDTVDFDPGPGVYHLNAPGSTSPWFLLKLDSAGQFRYAYALSPQVNGTGRISVSTGPNGHVYIAGMLAVLFTTNSVDLDPTPGIDMASVDGLNSRFILKLDSSGNYLWGVISSMGFGTGGFLEYQDITIDANGSLICTGYYSGKHDVDPGVDTFYLPETTGGNGIFILKLDQNGAFEWAKSIDGIGTLGQGRAVATDAQNNIYVTGFFGLKTGALTTVEVDFDPGASTFLLTTADMDWFILKLNSSGTFEWARQLGGDQYDRGSSISVDNSRGLVYTVGYAWIVTAGVGEFDMNPADTEEYMVTSSMLGANHIAVSILDTAGTFVWGGITGPIQQNNSSGFLNLTIAPGEDGSFYLGGTWESINNEIPRTVDFDPSPNIDVPVYYYGREDIFLMKFRLCTITDTNVTSHCDSFVFRGNNYTETGIYTDTLRMGPGICDTLFILDLTISGRSTQDTLSITACDSFNFNGQSYFNSGNFQYTFSSATGCDSAILLNVHIEPTPDTAVLQSGNTLTALATGTRYQWYDCLLEEPIAGATMQSYTPTTVWGYYAVIVGDPDGCQAISSCYLVDKGGTNHLDAVEEELNDLNVYPNPATSSVTIALSRPVQSAQLRLIDIAGKVVKVAEGLHGDRFPIDLQAVASGMYRVSVITPEGVCHGMFIKE